MPVKLILVHGTAYSVLFTIALLAIALKNPRLLLQDYPKEISKLVPPKSREEKRLARIFAIPFLLIFIGYPAVSGWIYTAQYGWDFRETSKFLWGVMLLLNVYDLLILDWLVVCLITPRFIILPGTEGHPAYKDYYFHFTAFLRGIIITLIISVSIAGLIALFRALS